MFNIINVTRVEFNSKNWFGRYNVLIDGSFGILKLNRKENRV